MKTEYSTLFSDLDKAIQLFIKEVDNQKLNNMATEHWSVKDVICHIVSWHKYYAHQYADLASNNKPFIFTSKGGSTRNQQGVNSLKKNSKVDLVRMLNNAQSSLSNSILIKKVPEMDYTNRTHYKTSEFLDVVTRHIERHTFQVRKAKEVPDKVR